MDYIKNNPTITEVILSGGDPLLVKDKIIDLFIQDFEKIPHVKILRIHSRIPIVLPERITEEFISILQKTKLKTVLVLHSNHANEIDTQVEQVLFNLKQANVTLFNQAVLLKNINNDAKTLADLSFKLFDIGVIPYYLHLLDKVQGTAHFEVSAQEAKNIIQSLRHTLPGYLVPKLVFEQAGELSKVAVL